MHDHLECEPTPTAAPRKMVKKKKAKKPEEPDLLTPMVVDGSPNFLSISLPSRESIIYEEVVDKLKEYNFKLEPSNRKWWLRDRHKVLNFLSNHWHDLEKKWKSDFTSNFEEKTDGIKRSKIKCSAEKMGDEFELTIQVKAGNAELNDIDQAIARGQNYVDTGDLVYLIEPNRIKDFAQAQRALSSNPEKPITARYRKRVKAAEIADVDASMDFADLKWAPPEEWKRRSISVRDVSSLRVPLIGKELFHKLRKYQRVGVAWMWHLYKNNLGGILADEMGLGKTVQALAVMDAIFKKQGKRKQPMLVVCPAGLVENWRREAHTFVPHLKVFVNHGADRLESERQFDNYDIIVTSYATLSRDVIMFGKIDFGCIIADEAQHIKNKQTRNAKSLQQMYARGRFMLTGTPVENSLDDLEALFDFLMPGYLVKTPSSSRGDDRLWYQNRMRQQAAPYILRRSKKLVAPELPKKIEQVIYCEMEEAQKNFYESLQVETEKQIQDMELAGVSEGKIKFATFAQLLRLRQICADPRILDAKFDAKDSAKLRAFREILAEAIDGGHRMLVFSQFVSVLTLLREELDESGIKYCYLDGKTRNRLDLVDKFNNDDSIPVFLISLKAGGTGLNLTGADTVVHFDPWWNPAVEAQATDRAHRIGQKRVVTSIKLIASSTVEEKVVALQMAKSEMLKDLLEASEAVNAKIGLGDLKKLIKRD